MQNSPIIILSLASLIAAFGSACSSSPPGDGGSTPCTIDAQCDSGESCVEGFCSDADALADTGGGDTFDGGVDSSDGGAEDGVETGDVAADSGDVGVDLSDGGQDVDGGGDVDGGQDADGGDTAEDADEVDTSTDADGSGDTGPDPPPVDCDPEDRNDCGGCVDLLLDGASGAPGDTCGDCASGVVACNGPSSLVCVGEADLNDCGGCEVLPPLTDGCGACGDGVLLCADSEGLECVGSTANACGGCGPLDSPPLAACDVEGDAGLWICTDSGTVECEIGSTATNICGGESTLIWDEEPAAPGAPCGRDLAGSLVCVGPDELGCSAVDEPNACGGVAELAGPPGEGCTLASACGDESGTWTCADEALTDELGIDSFDGVLCVVEGPRAVNLCGGCDDLAETPGDACGDRGAWICDGPEDVYCLDDPDACDRNFCGGCEPLGGVTGESCGACGSGVLGCQSVDALTCVGDRPFNEVANGCGGCAELTLDGSERRPGDLCGACATGVAVCNGPAALRCTGEGELNDCGGCEILPPLSTACGVCADGALGCAESDGLECVGSSSNDCGGCAPLAAAPLGGCTVDGDTGLWVCATPDAVECVVDSTATNPCGGESELTWDGAPAVLGTPCGAGLGGALICASPDAVECSSPEPANTCGGSAELAGAPGDGCTLASICGPASGAWRCADAALAATLGIEPFDGVVCVVDGPPAFNACGGCEALSDEPGTGCEGDGVWICDGANDLFCLSDPESCDRNACGGCEELGGSIGESCGLCDAGSLACEGPDALGCIAPPTDDATNDCGGCEPLLLNGRPADLGEPCGRCNSGSAACDGLDALTCEGDEGSDAENDCGGCGDLSGERGAACGTCDSGTLDCAVGGAFLTCASDGGDSALNACGGCEEIGPIGEVCGTCDTGVWACDGTSGVCEGDQGDAAINECDVCGPSVGATPGDACGTCDGGTVSCSEDGLSTTCEGDDGEDALNACGGCGDLGGVPDDPCGTCGAGTWTCSADLSEVTCEGDTAELNACGGCDDLEAEPSTPCGECGSGSWGCAGSDAVLCVGDLGPAARNGCGGCAALPGDVDGPCGTCDGGTYSCDGEDALSCRGDTLELNACGGCAELPPLGVPCGACDTGVVDCDGTEATLCLGDEGEDALNECGGCAVLENPVGSGCGECGSGAYACAEDNESTVCEGDLGPGATNACGGCGALDGAPLTACGTCDTGVWQCSGDLSSVTCEGDEGVGVLNACGGCAALAETIGDPCGTCGSGAWACDGEEAVTCSGDGGEDARNSCGGCAALDGEPDAGCGTCDSGTYQCDLGGESVSCVDDLGEDARNECGGCATLPGTVGEVCGDCSTHVYECDGGEVLRCTTEVACPPCEDGTRNGDETDVDCGGSCPACPLGDDCSTPSDCASGACETGVCVEAATCDDGIENGDETATDCGGSECDPCEIGESCLVPSDCSTDNCDAGTCVAEPTCDDGRANGLETDVDCGGECDPCVGYNSCIVEADCGDAWDCVDSVCTPPSITNPWIAFTAPGPLGLDIIHLIRADGTDLNALATTDIIQFDPAWSHDGRFLAYRTLGAPAPIRIVELATGAVTTLNPGLTSWSNPTWSPRGDAVMVEGSTGGLSDLWVVPISGDAPYQMGVTAFSDSAPDWQHTDHVYLVQNSLGIFEVFRRNTATLTDTQVTPIGTAILGGPDASWDGEQLAFVQRTGPTTTQAVVWDVASETSVVVGTAEAASPAFYPFGERLVVVDRSDSGLDIFVADAATGALLTQVTASSDSEASLVVSPRESADIPVWLVP